MRKAIRIGVWVFLGSNDDDEWDMDHYDIMYELLQDGVLTEEEAEALVASGDMEFGYKDGPDFDPRDRGYYKNGNPGIRNWYA